MVIRTFRFFARATALVAGLAAVLATAVVLRLLAGPVDLEILRPNFPNEFDTPDGRVKVNADHIYAEWSSLGDPMRLVFRGLHVVDAGHREIAAAPSVALSFDSRSAIRGRLLPTAIVVDGPTFEADITREGGILQRVLTRTDAATQGEFVGLLVDQLLAKPNHHSLLGQLDTVEVTNAHFSLKDVQSGVAWIAPSGRARLKRDATGVIISANARIGAAGGEPFDVALSGTYSRDRSRVSVEARVDGVKPSMFADLSPNVALLRGLDIALSGRLQVEASGAGEIDTIDVDVVGGSGTIILPGVLSATHKVRSVNAHAHVDARSRSAQIDHIDVDLGAAKIAIAGAGQRKEQGQSFSGRAEIRQIPVDRLGDYWPLDFAEGGRVWSVANLSGGTADIAADFALSAPGDDLSQIAVDRAVASLDYRGVTVHYMPHMPELRNVSGKARFEGGTIHFDVAGGTAVGLAVAGATIDMTGLDGPSQHAALRVPITGPAPTVVALLARPKLGLPRESLYDPKRLAGDAAIELTLGFPLISTLAVSDIDIKAEAAVSGLTLKNAIGNVDLTNAVGRIVYANSQLNVTGVGKLDGNPVDIAWRERFGPRAPYRQRYELKGAIPTTLIAKAGFPPLEPYVSGPVNVTSLSYQVGTNGLGEMQGRFDLKNAKLAVGLLGWTKEAGSEGQLALTLKTAPGGKLSSADFDGRAAGLAAKGQVRFAADSSVEQVALAQFSIGATDLAGEWRREGGGSDLSLSGRSLEYARVRTLLKAREEAARGTPAAAARERTRLTLKLDRFLLERGSLGSVQGRLELSGDRITSADLAVAAGRGSTVRITPSGQGRNLNVYVADFGQLLKETGWLDGFIGGDFDLRGHFDDAQAEAPLVGRLKIGPYRLEKVAPRAKVGTLNGAIDALNRAGNASQQFDSLEAALTKTGDRIELKNGHTSGKSIGLTTAGTIDIASDRASLRGIIVPAFALNNALSNVPLLGPLLTGGKDGGVFAVSYRLEGPLGDLKTDVNMMSAVTPGALRDVFNGNAGAPAPNVEEPLQRAAP